MSLLRTITAQLGLSNTPANNFTLDASPDNGTLKLARGNAGATTQDVITVDASGKPGFPQLPATWGQASSGVTNGGYTDLPNGTRIQYGVSSTSSGGQNTVTFPVAFVTTTPIVTATVGQTPLVLFAFAQVSDIGLTTFGLGSIEHNGTRVSVAGVQWTAIGRWK